MNIAQKGNPNKPAKPYPEVPLYPHATGRWAKRIGGRLHYFGPWDDPEGALQRYLDQRDDLHAGRKPRLKDEGLTVRELLNRFLTGKKRLVDAGELVPLMGHVPEESDMAARYRQRISDERPGRAPASGFPASKGAGRRPSRPPQRGKRRQQIKVLHGGPDGQRACSFGNFFAKRGETLGIPRNNTAQPPPTVHGYKDPGASWPDLEHDVLALGARHPTTTSDDPLAGKSFAAHRPVPSVGDRDYFLSNLHQPGFGRTIGFRRLALVGCHSNHHHSNSGVSTSVHRIYLSFIFSTRVGLLPDMASA